MHTGDSQCTGRGPFPLPHWHWHSSYMTCVVCTYKHSPATLSCPHTQDFHSGKTPLHLAVEKCSLTDVQFLTETCQVDINRATYAGCTPLHTAAGRGNIAVVAYLISMGADPDLLTDEGDSALDLAGSDQVGTILTKAAALRWLIA